MKKQPQFENLPTNSARFWTAAALCRFASQDWRWKSGRGLPQSKTLPRDSLNPDQLFGYSIFENALNKKSETAGNFKHRLTTS
jgi:hypothetical protein